MLLQWSLRIASPEGNGWGVAFSVKREGDGGRLGALPLSYGDVR